MLPYIARSPTVLSCGHFLVTIILTVFVPKTKIQTLYDKRSSIVYVLWDKKKVYL